MPKFEGEHYEIIDGELYITTQPHLRHQATGDNIIIDLGTWSNTSGYGRTFQAPNVIFSEYNAVSPDIAWVSKPRMRVVLGRDGKLHGAPDLMIEVLSPGKANSERDREKKVELYSRYAVQEYWVADWDAITLGIYRQKQGVLQLVQTLKSGDKLASPLLPGFACIIDRFFEL